MQQKTDVHHMHHILVDMCSADATADFICSLAVFLQYLLSKCTRLQMIMLHLMGRA